MKITNRRQFLAILGLGSTALFADQANARHTETHFEEKSAHRLVYQLNKADHDYIESILFSSGEMLRKYGDEIEIVIAAFGPGIHLLAIKPERPISAQHQKRVNSLMQYGVRFQACGNTMKSLNWTEKNIIEGAEIVPIGIDGIMQLQEQGFRYISL